MENKIDFVVTWVDGADEAWKKEKLVYSPKIQADDKPERYRDWDLLQYWFRGVETFAPWVRKVHFVTWGHLPKWLNPNHPKLHIVNHKDFIPEKYLPTYNSNAIEVNFHHIEGLSSHFVYFNDDMFPISNLKPQDFFQKGQPRDMLAFQPVVANPKNPIMSHIYLNNSLVLSRHFQKRQNVKSAPGNYFHIGYPPLYFFYNLLELFFPLYTGFYTVHGPFPLCKESFEKIWEEEREVMEATSSHRFRSSEDISLYLIREWKKLQGEFVPGNIQKDFSYYNVEDHNPGLVREIEKQKSKVVCINDANDTIDFIRAKKEITEAFEKILPQKSSFER